MQQKKILLHRSFGVSHSALFCIMICCIFFAPTAHAANAPGLVSFNQQLFGGMAEFLATVLSAVQGFSVIIFAILTALLESSFTRNLLNQESLNEIWKYSRDIMNVLFAFMLIGAGIWVVVTNQRDFLTAKAKQFILAVILVNFSWIFPRIILDAAHVLAATIYSLPSGVPNVECDADWNTEGIQQCVVITDVQFGAENCADAVDRSNENWFRIVDFVCWKKEPLSADTDASLGVLNGLFVNYARFTELSRLPRGFGGDNDNAVNKISEAFTLILYLLMVFLIALMIFLPMLAMFVVFLIRIPIMWITMAFMPFMFVGFVAEEKLTPGFNTMDIFKHFVKAAFLPAAVAVPFAVGFIVISQIGKIDCDLIAGETLLCGDNGLFLPGVQSLWDLFLLLMSAFIIWTGFWMALKIDDIYVNVTSGIKKFGETAGGIAVRLPLSVPILPTGSILGIDNAASGVLGNLKAGAGPLRSFGIGNDNNPNAAPQAGAGLNQQNVQALSAAIKDNAVQITEAIERDNLSSNEAAATNDGIRQILINSGIDQTSITDADLEEAFREYRAENPNSGIDNALK